MSAHQQQRASIEAELRKNKRLLQFVLQTQEMLTQPTVVPPAIFKATVRLPSPLHTRMRLVQTLRPLPALPASSIQSFLTFRVVGNTGAPVAAGRFRHGARRARQCASVRLSVLRGAGSRPAAPHSAAAGLRSMHTYHFIESTSLLCISHALTFYTCLEIYFLVQKDASAKPAAAAAASGPAPRYRIDVARGLVIDESISSVHYCSVACAEASLRFRATLSEDPVFLREGFRSKFSAPAASAAAAVSSSGMASLPEPVSTELANQASVPAIIPKAAPSARLDELVVTERSSTSAAPASVASSGANEPRHVRFEAPASRASATAAASSSAADGANDSEDAMFAEMARAMERAGMPADQSVERGRRMTSGTNDSISAAAAAATAVDHNRTASPSKPQSTSPSAQPPAPRGEILEREIAPRSADSAHGDTGNAEEMVDDAFFNQSGADGDSTADENGDEEPLTHITIGASFIQPASFRWSNEDLGDEEDGSENGDDDGYADEDEPEEGDDEAHASRDRVRMSSALANSTTPIMQINVWDHSADADTSAEQSHSQSQPQSPSQPQPNQQQVYIMPQPARAPPSVMQHHWRAELSPFARCHATIVQLTAANSAVKEFLNGAKWVQFFSLLPCFESNGHS
jgi:hypothetical protein